MPSTCFLGKRAGSPEGHYLGALNDRRDTVFEIQPRSCKLKLGSLQSQRMNDQKPSLDDTTARR